MKCCLIFVASLAVLHFSEASIHLLDSLEETRDVLLGFYDTTSVASVRPTSIKASILTEDESKARPVVPHVKDKKVRWSFGSRRRRSSLKRIKPLGILPVPNKGAKGVVAPIKKPVKPLKRALSMNKFSEVLEDIEKALAEAQVTSSGATHDLKRLRRLQELIKIAVDKRSYRFARKTIGEAMYTIANMKAASKKTGRTKRSTTISSKNFLNDVKQKLGAQAFSDLLAMQGQVTLMFTIDTTGSMSDDIQAAKDISKQISQHPRTEPVDYILSQFTDPVANFKDVQYFSEQEHSKFLTALSSIKAHGGGDCPEYAFKGILDAIEIGQPLDDSPMYVFTDASAKDGHQDNVKYLLEIAEEQGIVINFFIVHNKWCSGPNVNHDAFYEVAKATAGQVFRLNHESELTNLAGLTGNSLGGTTIISTATNTIAFRKKRSSGGKDKKIYVIPIDDTIETLVVSITADHRYGADWTATLKTSKGTIVVAQKMDKVIIYQVSSPSVGEWKLEVESASHVKYDYFAKGSSGDNIDFELYFVKKSKKASLIPISNPVTGSGAKAIITLGGVKNVDKTSLSAELINSNGVIIIKAGKSNHVLNSEDKRGVRYSLTFNPPTGSFKIKIKGKTKKGQKFERICHNPLHAESLLVKVIFAGDDKTVKKKATVGFKIENHGKIDERVEVKLFCAKGSVVRYGRKGVLRVRRGRHTYFRVTFTPYSTITKGDTATIVALVKGLVTKSHTSVSVPLLVV